MFKVRKSNQRGHFNHGWLNTFHTFSFGEYFDPEHMGFRNLRVINEDFVKPGQGFPTHGHKNMEIITYIIEGALEHKDSMGNNSVIRPGEVQRMTAGKGVLHSEFNPSATESVHLLQIWILPNQERLSPGYEQKMFSFESRKNNLKCVASKESKDGSVKINQDVEIFATQLEKGKKIQCHLSKGGYGWLQLIKGVVQVEGNALMAGDGLQIENEKSFTIVSEDHSEFLLFDLN